MTRTEILNRLERVIMHPEIRKDEELWDEALEAWFNIAIKCIED